MSLFPSTSRSLPLVKDSILCVCEVFQLRHFEIANSQKITSKKAVNVWNTLFYPYPVTTSTAFQLFLST